MLQELTVPSYVPNDALLVGGVQDSEMATSADVSPSMLLLTGPNYSGKTVYMKQVRCRQQVEIIRLTSC